MKLRWSLHGAGTAENGFPIAGGMIAGDSLVVVSCCVPLGFGLRVWESFEDFVRIDQKDILKDRARWSTLDLATNHTIWRVPEMGVPLNHPF